MASEFNISMPSIEKVGMYYIRPRQSLYVLESDMPSDDLLLRIGKQIADSISRLDARFDPMKHIYIDFLSFNRPVAMWVVGKVFRNRDVTESAEASERAEQSVNDVGKE